MKIIKKRLILVFTLLLVINIVHAGFEGNCEIRANCGSDTPILSVINYDDSTGVGSHLASIDDTYIDTGTNYEVCCPASELSPAECSSSNLFVERILQISAEGQVSGLSGDFSTVLCIDPDTIIQCETDTFDPNECPAEKPHCILRLSSAENAHVADCTYTDFTTAICCNTFFSGIGIDGREVFCPSRDQCGFSTQSVGSGDPADYTCIESGDFSGDNFCDFGIWKSRTHLIALQLFDRVDQNPGKDYTLYCDNKDSVTNYYGYFTEDATIDYLENSICVLNLDGDITIGMSFNIQEPPNDVLDKVLVGDKCSTGDDALDDSTADGNFHNCKGLDSDASSLWYNKKLNSTIYGNLNKIRLNNLYGSYTNPAEFDLNLHYLNETYLESKIGEILETLKSEFTDTDFPPFEVAFPPPGWLNTNYAVSFKKLNRIYFNKKGTKSIIGAIEAYKEGVNQLTYAVIKYENFDINMCDLIPDIDNTGNGRKCINPLGTKDYYLLLQGKSDDDFYPNDVWQDLTSKIRIP